MVIPDSATKKREKKTSRSSAKSGFRVYMHSTWVYTLVPRDKRHPKGWDGSEEKNQARLAKRQAMLLRYLPIILPS